MAEDMKYLQSIADECQQEVVKYTPPQNDSPGKESEYLYVFHPSVFIDPNGEQVIASVMKRLTGNSSSEGELADELRMRCARTVSQIRQQGLLEEGEDPEPEAEESEEETKDE